MAGGYGYMLYCSSWFCCGDAWCGGYGGGGGGPPDTAKAFRPLVASSLKPILKMELLVARSDVVVGRDRSSLGLSGAGQL